MKKSIRALEQIFDHQTDVSETRLLSLFDSIGVPKEGCWRTLYRVIFDVKTNSGLKVEKRIDRQHLRVIMDQALRNAENNFFTEEAFLSLIEKYNAASYVTCHDKLTEVLSELDDLSSGFKFISMRRKTSVERLESETLAAFHSDLSLEKKVQLIKSRFKEVVHFFQTDLVELDRIGYTDHLTRLYNRRFFDEKLRTEVSYSLVEKTWLTMLMIDIDDFKNFNDRHGHFIGDQALKSVANAIRDVCTEESEKTGIDIYPARYGGEEFSVIIPALDNSHSVKIAEAIRSRVNQYSFVIRNTKGQIKDKDISLSVSIGAAFLDHGKSVLDAGNDLIVNSDTAMYLAKKTGKNRVEVFKACV